jgi:phosphoenolpyruvate-protein phosphotransferase (PTS system enzyme I)
MCGEMAGDIRLIAILLGLGLDEFSINAVNLLGVKKIIHSLDYGAWKKICEVVLKLETSDQIRRFLANS